ncbi:hypothetical protein PAPHI01_0727 [Pancytospora philotis]|nr:hypothetical protein PAPHI01_0727 [Pancytospora philotis]
MGPASRITCFIAHIDHGKTTVMDSLVASQGHISRALAGDLRYMDSRADEQTRKITLKLGPVRLGNGAVFIDTPGHVDFESLIFCSSVLSDNFVVLVDVNEGITPRTYSLVKYIDPARAVLVLNKIDRAEGAEQAQLVVYQLNSLLGAEVFAWERNNIIIGCATLCCGVNHRLFRFSKKNTLRQAFAAFGQLEQKFAANDVDELAAKYKIRYKTKKNIFSTIMPLNAAIFDSISGIDETESAGASTAATTSPEQSSRRANECAIDIDALARMRTATDEFILKEKLFTIRADKRPAILGITVYGMFREKGVLEQSNVLFVTKLYHGELRRGDLLYSVSKEASVQSRVEHLYVFNIDRAEEVDAVSGPALVCIQGDFLKNSAISSEPVSFAMADFRTPFFMSKIVLRDLAQLEGIKAAIRAIALTEQCLKVRKNKFSELEVRCSGVVQFEKFCTDLEAAGFAFQIEESRREFREYPCRASARSYKDEDVEIRIEIKPNYESQGREDASISEACVDSDGAGDEADCAQEWVAAKNDNAFCIAGGSNTHVIESVLEIFVEVGPLIRENIMGACISVEVVAGSGAAIYNVLRKELFAAYMETAPQICPHLCRLTISVEREYLGQLYNLLERCFSLVDGEEYNDETGFIVVVCRIAQFELEAFMRDLSVRTRGTAYAEVDEAGYSYDGDFSALIDGVRRGKGMYTGEMIIENPEKQRTLRK